MENTTSNLLFSLLGIHSKNTLGIRYQFNIKNAQLYIECETASDVYVTPTKLFMDLMFNKLKKLYKIEDNQVNYEEGHGYSYHSFNFVGYEYAEMKKIKLDIIAELQTYSSFVGIEMYGTTRSTTIQIESYQNFEDFLIYLNS